MINIIKSLFYALVIALVISKADTILCENWDEIASLAGNNDGFVSAMKQRDSAQWSYNRAWSNFLPQLSASGSYSETLGAGSAEAVKSYSYGLSATQYLFKGMQNYYGLRSAYANYQYNLASFKKTESNIYFNLRMAFIGLSIAQQNLELSGKILDRLKENARLIKLRYESGREDRGNLLATTASEKEAEYDVSSAKRELEIARLKLAQLCSKKIEKAEGNIDVSVEADPDFQALTQTSPSYIMAKYQLETADIAAQNTIGEFLPSVSLNGSYQNRGSQWPPDSLNRSWSLNISYSLFPGGANIADKFINDLNAEKARRDFKASSDNITYDIMDAYRKVKDATEIVDVKNKYLEATEERAKIADAKYLNGLITYDEWNRIIKDLISAQKDMLRTKRSAIEASAAWKNIYGGWEKL